MLKLTLIAVGCVAALLAIAGVLLPGLPATPFLLVALWAFARSSERLYARIMRLPVLREAMIEARRFEDRRAVRPAVKLTAVATAWTSVLLTVLLLAAGTVLTLMLEWNHALAAAESWGERLSWAFFHSTMTRTAGFNVVDTGQMQPAALFTSMALMFVGGPKPGPFAFQVDNVQFR